MAAAGQRDVRQLLLQVDASVALAQRNVAQLTAQVQRDSDRMDRSLAGVDAATARLGAGFSRLQNLAGSLGVSLGVGAVVNFGRSMLGAADDLQAAADRAGVGVERFQTLREALRTLEVRGETVDKMFERLLSTLGDVQNGVDNGSTQAIERLGIKHRILNGEIATSDQLLDAIAEASQRAGSQAQFASEMAAIFGRRMSGQLVPALRDGGGALHDLEQALHDSGSVVEEEIIAKFAAANETLDRFWASSQRNAIIWSAAIIAEIEEVGRAIEDSLPDLGRVWDNAAFALSMAAGQPDVSILLNRPAETAARAEQERRRQAREAPWWVRPDAPWWAQAPETGPARIPPRPDQSRERQQRTEQQAWNDFAAELRRRGVEMTPGGGHRTAGQQRAIFERGLSPLDGYSRPSRHQSWQAFDPRSRTHNEQAVREAAAAAGLRGFEIVRESRGRVHYEWTGHGRRGEPDFSTNQETRLAQMRQQVAGLRGEFDPAAAAAAELAEQIATIRRLMADPASGLGREEGERWIDEARFRGSAGRLSGVLGGLDPIERDEREASERRDRDRDSIKSLNRDAEDRLHLLRMEIDLGGVDETQRRRILAMEEQRLELQRQFGPEHQQEIEAILATAAAEDALLGQIEEVREAQRAVREIGRQIVADLASGFAAAAMNARDLDDAIDVIEDSLLRAGQALLESGLLHLMTGGREGIDLGSLLGGLVGIGGGGAAKVGSGKAGGGAVFPGTLYPVGERGIELFAPKVPGVIIPNHALGSGGGNTVQHFHFHQKIQFEGVAVTEEQLGRGLAVVKHDTIEAVRQMQRRAA